MCAMVFMMCHVPCCSPLESSLLIVVRNETGDPELSVSAVLYCNVANVLQKFLNSVVGSLRARADFFPHSVEGTPGPPVQNG